MTEANLERIEQEYERSGAEYRALTNRLNRYWKKLVREGLAEAQSRGLEIRVVDGPIHFCSGIIVLRDDHELNATELLELAKEKFPGLHRKYSQGLRKHKVLTEQIEDYIKAMD